MRPQATFGQSVAYASQLFGCHAVIALPSNPNPGKAEAIRNFGAELLTYGADYDEARGHLQTIADEKGYRLFNDAEDHDFVSGLGTCMVEILQDLPDAEVVIVPIGGAGFASSLCIAGKAIRPDLEIIGVSSEAALSPVSILERGASCRLPHHHLRRGHLRPRLLRRLPGRHT